MARDRIERDRELSWDYADATGNQTVFDDDPLLVDHTERQFQSFTENTRRPLLREDLLLLIESLETSSNVLRAALEDADYSDPPTPLSNSQTQLHQRESWYSRIHNSCCNRPILRKILYWVLRYHFLITVVIQLVNIAVISVLDEFPTLRKHDKKYISMSAGILISLEVISLLVIVVATANLSRQMLKHKVSSWFLAQVYLATILLFSGIYTATFKLSHDGWKDIGEDITQDPVLIVDLFVRMFFLSVSTATLCGASFIKPNVWYNYIFVSTQMLLSFVYFAQILAQSMQAGSLLPFVQRKSNTNRNVNRRIVDDQSSVHTEVQDEPTH